MGLLQELGIAPADVHIGEIEKQMAGNGLPAEGIHHAVLQSAGAIPNAEGRGWKMVFEIIAGAGKGMTVEEAVWKPKGDDAKKDATTKNRILLFAHRLGLMKKVTGPDGKETSVEVEGKHEFCDCLGTPCFLELRHEQEKYTKGDKERTIMKAKLTFNGLLSADDKKVKEAIAAGKLAVASGSAVADAKAGATSAASAKATRSNIDDL